ncbi:unnamed protein product [Cunninghamella blakesleeana]
MTDDDLLQRVWKLTNDLTRQQQTNQDIATDLRGQLDNFKKHTVNEKEDFDQDIDDFLPELLPANLNTTIEEEKSYILSKHVKLIQEHHQLQDRNNELEQERQQLQSLVDEYESQFEKIASKLRAYANSSSEGQIQLRREYEALLSAEKETTAALFVENTMLQSQLSRLSNVLRNIYEQETIDSHDERIYQLELENQGLREMLNISENIAAETNTNNNSNLITDKLTSKPNPLSSTKQLSPI